MDFFVVLPADTVPHPAAAQYQRSRMQPSG